MFTAYIDDSGSDPSQHVVCAAAFIIPGRRIIALEKEWDSLKAKEGFTDFHTSVFVARNPKSDFAAWSDEKQQRVFRRVRQIVRKFGAKVISFTVNKKDYDDVVPIELSKYSGKHHYTWAIRQVVAELQAWRIGHHIEAPLEYVFDWMKKGDQCRNEIETVMEEAERITCENGTIGDFTNYSFRHRSEIPGLQCVDCAAWVSYQYGLLVFRNKPLHPFAALAAADWHGRDDDGRLRSRRSDWFSHGTVERHNLAEWVAKEMADGISIARFKRWEQEKQSAKTIGV